MNRFRASMPVPFILIFLTVWITSIPSLTLSRLQISLSNEITIVHNAVNDIRSFRPWFSISMRTNTSRMTKTNSSPCFSVRFPNVLIESIVSSISRLISSWCTVIHLIQLMEQSRLRFNNAISHAPSCISADSTTPIQPTSEKSCKLWKNSNTMWNI